MQPIDAIFDAGVFRPLEPVSLAPGTRVIVQVQPVNGTASDEVDNETRTAWLEYLKRMESMPVHAPGDGFTNRDHDRIIYGA
jgi:predicted DNA-binding antitoxin AbrB/MazE fold protein